MKLLLLPLLTVALSLVHDSLAVNQRRQDSRFVSVSGDHFVADGKSFKFVGTNAYWLPTLDNVQDVNKTLAAIAAANITVVRLWAFNDVTAVPTNPNETYFQVYENGTFSVNTGPNGLQRLDQTIELAAQNGLYVLLTLTNNWFPTPNTTTNSSTVSTSPPSPPRGVLSNSYGGMDFYVREYRNYSNHESFYTDAKILDAFKNYTTQIASRYSNSSTVFGYELANDPRCNSTLPAQTCNPQDITRWHATLSDHVKSVDPNHIVASGSSGFFCLGCPKIYTTSTPTAPPPSTPSNPSRRRARQALAWKKTRTELIKRNVKNRQFKALAAIKIRGRWATDASKSQVQEVGPAYDGSFGVDSEDIAQVPNISLVTFQLFPDQNNYGVPTTIGISPINASLSTGLQWIDQQISAAQVADKPSVITGFGLVTRNNTPFFVPFNESSAPFATSASDSALSQFASDAEQIDTYSKWLANAISNGVAGLIQYQWGSSGLDTTSTTVTTSTTNSSSTPTTIGTSPNDGYSFANQSPDQASQVTRVLSNAADTIAQQAAD